MSKPAYIVAEIGQNHNGSVKLAKQLIELASIPIIEQAFGQELNGVNAIKLQKRDLDEEMTISANQAPYDSPHSYGKTYGEHRAVLELSDAEHEELYYYAKERGLDFIETICSPGALSILKKFKPDYLKVASRDLTNLPLIEKIAETGLPLILSLGMAGEVELEEALAVIGQNRVAILHCLSEYPAQYEHINLRAIPYLRNKYPKHIIGYSDHSVGIVCPVVAVSLGAQIIEKHITLNRNMKGSDHRGSLAPDGLIRMVRDIRNVERALGRPELARHPVSEAASRKLERSIACRRDMKAGEVIAESDLILLSPGTGLRWSERDKIVGRRLVMSVPKHELIMLEYLGVGVPQPV